MGISKDVIGHVENIDKQVVTEIIETFKKHKINPLNAYKILRIIELSIDLEMLKERK